MKKTITYISCLLAGFTFLISCKNDLDVFAPGKESVSVYGILNPNESVQNIRINKVYLTEGDALATGQDANQINYGSGELTVKLQRFMTATSTTPTLTTVGNTTKKEIELTETVVTTQGGIFNQNQRIWQTTDKLFPNGYYKMIIKNNVSGIEYSALSLVIDSVRSNPAMPFIYYPNPNPAIGYPMHGGYVLDVPPGTGTPKRAYVDYSTTTINQKIKFNSIVNAKLYSVVMRFHYIDSIIGGGVNYNYVDYSFPTIQSSGIKGGEALEVAFTANDFYVNAAQLIAKKSVSNLKNRRSHYIEYIINAGTEGLSDFLQVNAPSTSIAQDKPYYTNIQGGVGVFSARSRSSITKDLWTDFINKIACHPSTQPLLFCNSAGVTVPNSCN